MKIIQLILKIILTSLIVILSSCCPVVTNSYVIKNTSTQVIEAKVCLKEDYREIGSPDIIWSISVDPKSETEIISYSEIGAAADKNVEFLEAFDTLMVVSNDTPILKDIKNRNSWKFKVVDNGMYSDKVEYQLTLTNSDIK